MGHSPQGHRESDTAELINTTHILPLVYNTALYIAKLLRETLKSPHHEKQIITVSCDGC